MSQRIYAVSNKADGSTRLVKATNPSQALRHVANAQFDVKAATATQVADLMVAGAKLELVSVAVEQEDEEAATTN